MKKLLEVGSVARKVDVEDLFVTLFVGAILLPIAISQFTSVDTSTWSSTLATIWENIPVVGLVGVLVGLLYKYLK